MRNLISVISVVLIIGSVYGQSDSSLFNSEIDEIVNDVLREYDSKSGQYLNFKKGDNDLAKTVGILEFIFSDDSSKYRYGIINPRINMLLVHNMQDHPEIPFHKWVEEKVDVKTYSDSTKYNIVYEGFGLGSEDLRIYDVETGKCIRWIALWYDNFNTTNEYQNLVSISDEMYK